MSFDSRKGMWNIKIWLSKRQSGEEKGHQEGHLVTENAKYKMFLRDSLRVTLFSCFKKSPLSTIVNRSNVNYYSQIILNMIRLGGRYA